eukprot:CAMPEP_0113259708 /NCGR_PEP_ID=MMETSP0008_2-20120614/16496_1 /TAXON_ID=97485 /ORGANISM="Prymnesium parvum" /LENGTH=636 /DNA_ID=CAMNT_0000108245 /DNA_START=80 /DNA_END=1991 /DNA_ORIENTATION=- /assembly_acc=CAM_ASM_000153
MLPDTTFAALATFAFISAFAARTITFATSTSSTVPTAATAATAATCSSTLSIETSITACFPPIPSNCRCMLPAMHDKFTSLNMWSTAFCKELLAILENPWMQLHWLLRGQLLPSTPTPNITSTNSAATISPAFPSNATTISCAPRFATLWAVALAILAFTRRSTTVATYSRATFQSTATIAATASPPTSPALNLSVGSLFFMMAALLVFFPLLVLYMHLMELINNPLTRLGPILFSALDVCTDLRFIWLCLVEDYDRLEDRGVLFVGYLSLVVIVSTILLSACICVYISYYYSSSHKLWHWAIAQNPRLYGIIWLVSPLMNLTTLRLLPWRAKDFAGMPAPSMIFLVLVSRMIETVPQVALQLFYVIVMPNCFSSETVSNCDSLFIAIASLAFSIFTLFVALLEAKIVSSFRRRILRWSWYDRSHVREVNPLGAIIAIGPLRCPNDSTMLYSNPRSRSKFLLKSPSKFLHSIWDHGACNSCKRPKEEHQLQDLPVAVGSFTHSTQGCKTSWTISILSDRGDSRLQLNEKISIHVGVCDAGYSYDPSRHVMGYQPRNSSKVVYFVYEFLMNNGTHMVTMVFEKGHLTFQTGKGPEVSEKLVGKMSFFCAWCTVPCCPLIINENDLSDADLSSDQQFS